MVRLNEILHANFLESMPAHTCARTHADKTISSRDLHQRYNHYYWWTLINIISSLSYFKECHNEDIVCEFAYGVFFWNAGWAVWRAVGERGRGISSLVQPHVSDVGIVLRLQLPQGSPSAGLTSRGTEVRLACEWWHPLALAGLWGPCHPLLIPLTLFTPHKLVPYVTAIIWTIWGWALFPVRAPYDTPACCLLQIACSYTLPIFIALPLWLFIKTLHVV